MHILNLFGDGVRYWICDLDAPVMEPVIDYKEKHLLAWDQVLFDLSALKRLGYTHWGDLAFYPEKSGMILSENNRIELKKASRFLEKFRAEKLISEDLIFPQYQTEIIPSEIFLLNQLVILQFETGLIGKYRIEVEKIRMDDLTFILEQPIRSEEDLLLTGLTYKGELLFKTEEDTVVRGLRVVV